MRVGGYSGFGACGETGGWEAALQKTKENLGLESTTARSDFEAGLLLKVLMFVNLEGYASGLQRGRETFCKERASEHHLCRRKEFFFFVTSPFRVGAKGDKKEKWRL